MGLKGGSDPVGLKPNLVACHKQMATVPSGARSNSLIVSAHGARGLSERSLMVDLLRYFSFQPGCGMCYSVCGMVHIKDPLLLIGKSSSCSGSRFPLSLSEWSFTICPMPYNHKYVSCVSLNKPLPSFLPGPSGTP